MVEMDPGLDTKLRAFFDRIEASPAPSALTDIATPAPSRRRRTINLVVGFAAVAVVAAGVTLFGVELGNHHAPAKSELPPSAAQLKKMPLLGNGGIPTSARVLIPLTRGHGSQRLKTIVPSGTLLLQFDCAGPGSFSINSTNRVIGNRLDQCSSSFGVTTLTVDGAFTGAPGCPPGVSCPTGYDGTPVTLDITAAPSTSWEILVAETTVWFPPLDPLQADSQLLVGPTVGAGSTTLPTFSVAPDESVRATVLCSSATSGKTLEIAPDAVWPEGQQVPCFAYNSDTGMPKSGTPISYVGPAVSTTGSSGLGPISTQFSADPSINWEIQVSEGPDGILLPELGNQGPVTQNVSIAPQAMGIGSAVLPSFTPHKDYTVAFSCSGAGSLTIVIGGVDRTATTQCGGHTGWFTPPDQVPGQPLSLSVVAAPGVGWEIQPEQLYGSTWGAGGPNMSNRT
jgi:hypothetical protein